MSTNRFGTSDGHNPEIIYHLLEHQREFGLQGSYSALDQMLRRKGVSAQQALLSQQDGVSRARRRSRRRRQEEATEATEEGTEAVEPSEPSSSDDLEDANVNFRFARQSESEEFSDREAPRDYFHAAHHIYDPEEIVRHMTTVDGDKDHFFSPSFDAHREQWYEQNDGVPEMPGPFHVLCPDPAEPGKKNLERITLGHVYLPGWPGRPADGVRSATEWQNATFLARGRSAQVSLYRGVGGYIVPLHRAVLLLGFPTTETFLHFVHRPDVKAAFRELWDAGLGQARGDAELPATRRARRPVALRVFYARTLDGCSEFDDERPDKTGWGLLSHLARFCLQVEQVCNRTMMPPLRGQIPILTGNVPSAVVAWGGIELARLLRRMQKGCAGRVRYLDGGPPV